MKWHLLPRSTPEWGLSSVTPPASGERSEIWFALSLSRRAEVTVSWGPAVSATGHLVPSGRLRKAFCEKSQKKRERESEERDMSVNSDLQRERAAAGLESEDFARWWAGGDAHLLERRSLEEHFYSDPRLQDAVHPSCLSYKERYEQTVAKATLFLAKLRAWQKAKHPQMSLDVNTLKDFRVLLSGSLGTGIFQQSFPLRLHFSMFMTTLLGQGTEEQQAQWLSRAWHMDGVVGTYAQTELGHGTYIRGLETRADYDPERQEFVLNTPTQSAYKWWPGGLGNTANVAIVLAQLYIQGKHHGLQSFLVRIRDERTHEPLPGIDVGDIGPRLGGNGVNNGFLGLKDVRIPRNQMMMKNAQVLPDGTFVQGRPPLLLYGTMVYVRVITVRDVLFCLLQAATIATR